MDDAGAYYGDLSGFDEEPTPQERSAALARALRQKQMGYLNQYSGDEVLAPIGQGLVRDAEQTQSAIAASDRNRLLRRTQAEHWAQSAQTAANALQQKAEQQQWEREHPKQNIFQTPDGMTGAVDLRDPTKPPTVIHQATKKLTRGDGAVAGGPPGPDEAAMIEGAAKDYNLGAGLPSMGSGKDAAALKKAIMMRAAVLRGEGAGGVAEASANRKANVGSLTALQGQKDKADILENTALSNLDLAVSKAEKLGGIGIPLLNAPYQAALGMLGDADKAAYDTARNAAIGEAGKLLSGSLGNGGLTEGARHEVSNLIKEGASIAQIKAASAIIHQDIANRQKAAHNQIEEVKGRIGGKSAAASEGKSDSGRQVVRKQQNKGLNKTRITYSDGTTEDVDGLQ